MKKKFVFIYWDTPFPKRKEMETLQHLSLSLKFKDYDFLAEHTGLCPNLVYDVLKNCSLKKPQCLPLFKKAVKAQLLRDVCIL